MVKLSLRNKRITVLYMVYQPFYKISIVAVFLPFFIQMVRISVPWELHLWQLSYMWHPEAALSLTCVD
jgi:hypothetical protein